MPALSSGNCKVSEEEWGVDDSTWTVDLGNLPMPYLLPRLSPEGRLPAVLCLVTEVVSLSPLRHSGPGSQRPALLCAVAKDLMLPCLIAKDGAI